MTNATIQYLESLKLPELQKLAMQNNLIVHHKTGEKKLRQLIADKILADMVAPPEKQRQGVHEPKIQAVHFNSREDIEKIVEKIQTSKPDFKAEFSSVDPTVKFTYRGAMDTCNLSLPIRQIQMCANGVARGAYVLESKNEHFDSLVTNSHSSYTAKVL